MKILVVDDEYYARKALVQIIQDWNSDATIIEAEDGQAALTRIKEEMVDLILSDIRMPKLDGMQLAEEIYHHSPLLASFVHSDHGELSADQLCLSHMNYYCFAVVQFKESFSESLIQLLRHTLSTSGIQLLGFPDSKYRDMFTFLLAAEEETRLTHCMGIIDRWKNEHGPDVSVGIGDIREANMIKSEGYKEASYALLYRLLMNTRGNQYGEVYRNDNYKSDMLDELLPSVYNKMVKHQVEGAIEIVEKLFYSTAELNLTIHTLYEVCAKLIATLNSFIYLLNQSGSKPEAYVEQINLYKYHDLDSLIRYFSERIVEVTSSFKEAQSKLDIVEQLKDYIEQNYRHDIVLEDIAKTIFYTDATYLSRLFKKKIGMGFSQFLLSIRMNNSKRLLQEEKNITVAEVADAVGFNDYSYFIQMYKKFFGETPGRAKRRE
jgi:two-component system response regulator YesN